MDPYKLELLNIQKSFGGVTALKDVTLKARSGKIHAIVGENGAGKSTLMKILAGAYRMDSGEILINGEKVRIDDTRDGRKSGVGIIYQEFSLVPDLSVAENVYLHYLNTAKIWMPWSDIHARARDLIGSLGFEIPTHRLARNLSTSHQQVVEIAKALSEKVEILILDEPTAVLAPQDTRKLFEVLGKLRERGVTILYISHRLEEVFEISDAITILKDGEVTRSAEISSIDQDEVIRYMIGRKLDALFPGRQIHKGKIRLEVKNLHAGGKVKDVSFCLMAGEVLGVGGLVGSGRTEMVRAVFSADRRDKGEILLDGERVTLRSPGDAVRAGLGFVPEDRKTQGLLLSLSVRENLTLTDLGWISGSLGFIREGKERTRSKDLMERLGIRAGNTEINAEQLSGGNQQKVVLAKWLGRNCRVIIMDEPTRGIDVGAKAEIYNLINELSDRGISILIVSSEMIELMGICDRILVMHEGGINGELARPDFSEENIMRLSIENMQYHAKTDN
jgi:ribose transport system ATP-binding protein